MKTRCAVLYECNKPLVVEELILPELGYGQVLVRLVAAGICHTQLLEIKGKKGTDKYLPHALGHEGAGIVDAVGPGVSRVSKGDPVILSWIKGSGIDAGGTTYSKNGKKINAGPITVYSDYSIMSENRLTKISRDMPLDKAALMGCALATGFGAVINTAHVEPGSSVAVFGAGGVGLCAIQAAALRLASKIIAVDLYPRKLETAKSLGATHAVNARTEDAVQSIISLTGGLGVDYAIEAAGAKESMEQAHQVLRRQGGLAVLIGNLPHQTKISIDPFEVICGKRLVGSWGGETKPERDFPRYVDLFLKGTLKLDALLSHSFSLEDINSAFEVLAKGEAARAIIQFHT